MGGEKCFGDSYTFMYLMSNMVNFDNMINLGLFLFGVWVILCGARAQGQLCVILGDWSWQTSGGLSSAGDPGLQHAKHALQSS